MIAILFNKRDFEYDVHSLVRAFYSGTQVSIYYPENPITDEYELKICLNYGKTQIQAVFYEYPDLKMDEETIELDYEKDRKDTKNQLKRLLYRMLQSRTGQTLPWGTLTGIRPTKITMGRLEQGYGNGETAQWMRETFLTSNEKTALSIAIANRERHLLSKLDYEKGYSLYIGIPFCPSICLYCSFSSSPIGLWREQVEDYLDALIKEMTWSGEAYKDRVLDTIYIGGGTPTTLEPEQLERLLSAIEENFDIRQVKEFTVEAGRPDSITKEKLSVIKKHPVTRISINPQTMNQETLDIIGRKHTVEQTVEAFWLARKLGFDNINMDLIVGLPGEDQKDVESTLKGIVALDPDSITVHSLAVKRAARLNIFRDQYEEMSFTNNQTIMSLAARYATVAEMVPYYLYRQKNMAGNLENVGYAKEGKECLYNILIMEEKQTILALGAGSSTKLVHGIKVNRIENVKDIKLYVEKIDEIIQRKKQGIDTYGK